MPEYIYVLGMDGKPQMPTTRMRHVQKLLNTGKARIAEHVPFTIQLLYENKPVLQPVLLAEDPGRTNIGIAALSETGDLLLSAVAETRNREIVKLMDKRRQYRRASRNGERKVRQRLARRYHTELKDGSLDRKLPMYADEKYVTCKVIRNTQARFCNRKRPEGWLTPSARQLVETHIQLVHRIQKYLPVTDVTLEVNRFAFMLMEDPSVSGTDFQNGPLKGYADLQEAVTQLQDGKCLLCGGRIEHYHHIVPRSRNGSNTINNIAGLCADCHEKVHKDKKCDLSLRNKKDGLDKRYGALSVLNQAIPFICGKLEKEFGPDRIHYCTGRGTAGIRHAYGFHKTKENPIHEVDAWCIGIQALRTENVCVPDFTSVHTIRQFRKQDRSRIRAQTERTYYLNGKAVAKNRRKRMDQKTDSLNEWYEKQVQAFGESHAKQMKSQLTVAKSQRRYNEPHRLMPGAVFYYKGARHVLSGSLTNGKYFRAVGDPKTNYPARDCIIRKHNEGFVFIG